MYNLGQPWQRITSGEILFFQYKERPGILLRQPEAPLFPLEDDTTALGHAQTGSNTIPTENKPTFTVAFYFYCCRIFF